MNQKTFHSMTSLLIDVIPMGLIDSLVMSVVVAYLQTALGINTKIAPLQTIPKSCYLPGRNQYDAGNIITLLSNETPNLHLKLGVTDHDISSPILTYVFGESQLGGNAALISVYRLWDKNKTVTCERAAKIAIHEVSHVLGIGHCREMDCLMRFSSNLEKLDQIPIQFCNSCAYEVKRQIQYRISNCLSD